MDKEEGVKHDRLREGDRENRLHQNGGGRAGITTDRGGRSHADETHANG